MASLLHRNGVGPPPGPTFIHRHRAVLAGTDFFTVEVLTWRGLVTWYVLFFLHLDSRKVTIGGMTEHPGREWMQQIARNATLDPWGHLNGCRYVLHDRDTKFCRSFQETLAVAEVKCLRLPARSPNLNAYAERWVRSVKQECLSPLILWRRLAQASSPAIHGTLPCGAEPSRKEQPLAVPRRAGQTKDPCAASDSLQGAAWRASEVLSPPCRLSILTIRGTLWRFIESTYALST